MHIYIVIGPSGVGKTTIGKMLSEKLDIPYYDADDFHSAENIAKMKNGVGLTDQDRLPWLRNLAGLINEWYTDKGAVLACSALKEAYRKQLMSVPAEDITWIYLHGDEKVINHRLLNRKDHFFDSDLFKSQYSDLEVPQYGCHINVNKEPEAVLNDILACIKKNQMKNLSEIGLIGLGVMGKSLALNMDRHDMNISVYNRHVPHKEERVALKFVEEQGLESSMLGFDNVEKFIASLKVPRNIFLMVNAGAAVDMVIESLLSYLESGDLIIDGGNSHYEDTRRREKLLKEKGIHFLGVGISGGEEGALNGPSMMPGGSKAGYKRVGKLLETIAAKDKSGKPCCVYIGPEGSGHFVKMVHNGIEYAEMQTIAEIYNLLRYHLEAETDKIADIFDSWLKSGADSYLLEITIDILRTRESGDLLLDKILDAAKQKNTGGWTVEAGFQLGVPLPTIAESVMARSLSSRKSQRIRAMGVYGRLSGLATNGSKPKVALDKLYDAFQAARIINHASGFSLLYEASEQHNWQADLSEIARIWTNGCIIRSELMESMVDWLKPYRPLLLLPEVAGKMKEFLPGLTAVVTEGLSAGFALPVLSSALNYFLGYASGESPANLIQAQRDYFGAHTYQRIDKPKEEHFHTKWK